MHQPKDPSTPGQAEEFSRQAESPSPGLLREFWDFLCENKKWWLLPIILVLLAVSLLVLLPPALTLIYPLM